MAWIGPAILVLQALPTLVNSIAKLIDSIEDNSQPKSGEQKKALVMKVIEGGLDAASDVKAEGPLTDAEKQALLKVSDKAVDSYVAYKNETGMFTHIP